jgi:hypothetical protein
MNCSKRIKNGFQMSFTLTLEPVTEIYLMILLADVGTAVYY